MSVAGARHEIWIEGGATKLRCPDRERASSASVLNPHCERRAMSQCDQPQTEMREPQPHAVGWRRLPLADTCSARFSGKLGDHLVVVFGDHETERHVRIWAGLPDFDLKLAFEGRECEIASFTHGRVDRSEYPCCACQRQRRRAGPGAHPFGPRVKSGFTKAKEVRCSWRRSGASGRAQCHERNKQESGQQPSRTLRLKWTCQSNPIPLSRVDTEAPTRGGPDS